MSTGSDRHVGRVTTAMSVTPPTLADVAERAGVSRQTVSNAVNNPDLLRADTLTRVLAAIEELGYSPNRAARNLRTRASHLIGMRISPAQEGTANATMDRFVHTLVETSRDVSTSECTKRSMVAFAVPSWAGLIRMPIRCEARVRRLRAARLGE